jgi:hypothetical protein
MTGGILSFGVSVIEHLRGDSLTTLSFGGVGIIAMMWGAYLAWGREHDRAEAAQVKIKELECPPNRPQVSLVQWGVTAEGRSGFYLKNHGGVALEATVERFRVGQFWINGETTAEVAAGCDGFAFVWLETSGFDKFSIIEALRLTWDKQFKSHQLSQGQPLSVPLSVVYRDFGNLWYRSECDMKYLNNRVEFSSTRQTCFGISKPALIR